MKQELEKYKFHPRIMELRLAMIKKQLERQYGEEVAMNFLKTLSDMFQCNFTLLVTVFNRDNKILNQMPISMKRKKQEIILMGHLYNETRYYISHHYLHMSTNYLYQSKLQHNPEIYSTEEFLAMLDDEVLACGVRAYAIEAKRFIVSFDNFIGVFK
jgi:hypothetical protein